MSVTEGEDKPLKYPTIFNGANTVAITKADLSEAAQFDSTALESNFPSVRPGVSIQYVCAKNGEGMPQFVRFLEDKIHDLRKPTHDGNPAQPNVSLGAASV